MLTTGVLEAQTRQLFARLAYSLLAVMEGDREALQRYDGDLRYVHRHLHRVRSRRLQLRRLCARVVCLRKLLRCVPACMAADMVVEGCRSP